MSLLQVIGGLGLFLLGMITMTDGLKSVAGDAMRLALMKFTRSPLSGAITGAVSTAILQSSSATTVAVVGFVNAGLLGFSNALGIIFGANVGTTFKGWLVALIGFKLKLGVMLMPLILAGAILRLFSRGKLAMAGLALAGFGLIFVGITLMQEGMAAYQGVFTPNDLPSGGVFASLMLVGIGMLVTVITQSSSAGVATTLTALYAGVIEFEQAAALVIGMDVGTTVTALLASIGGSISARRTGLSHVIYNLMTATGALIFIAPFIWGWKLVMGSEVAANPEVALVAFHTVFNCLGVILVLPFTQRFADLIERIVPDRLSSISSKLDRRLLAQPQLAIAAAHHVATTIFQRLLVSVSHLLGGQRHAEHDELIGLEQDLERLDEFTDDIELQQHLGTDWDALIAINHALDHLDRLYERCKEDADRAATARMAEELEAEKAIIIETVELILQGMQESQQAGLAEKVALTHDSLKQKEPQFRAAVMERIARGELDLPEGRMHLEAIRWLRRVSHHMTRITQYLGKYPLVIGKEKN